MHVCKQRCVMVPVPKHKIVDLTNSLPTHSLITSSSAAGG